MTKKSRSNRHNLNKKKGNKIILLILALIFVAAPIFTLIAYLFMLVTHPFL